MRNSWPVSQITPNQIDFDIVAPVGGIAPGHGSDRLNNTGVVDQRIDPAETLHGIFNRRKTGIVVGNIRRANQRFAAQPADTFSHLIEAFFRAGQQGYTGFGPGQPAGNGRTQTAFSSAAIWRKTV